MSEASPHNPIPVKRDSVLLAEYEEAKRHRAINSIDELGHLPDGLAERFTDKIKIIQIFLDCDQGGLWGLFEIHLVSSWVDGSGIDKYTEQEEPEFWELKKRKKTWDGKFPKKFKVSDFDINIFTTWSKDPVDLQGLIDLDHLGNAMEANDPNRSLRLDIYPNKGEKSILIPRL